MLRRDASAKRSALALVFLLACLAPWPRLGALYSSVWCSLLEAVFGDVRFASTTSMHFMPGSAALLRGRENPFWHVVVALSSSSTGATTQFAVNLRAIGYVPDVTFLALVLAWPFDRRPSWRPVVAGFGLVQAYFLLSLALPILLTLSSERVEAIELDPVEDALARTAFGAFVVPPAMSYAVPAIIFTAVVLLGSAGPARTPGLDENRLPTSGIRRLWLGIKRRRRALAVK